MSDGRNHCNRVLLFLLLVGPPSCTGKGRKNDASTLTRYFGHLKPSFHCVCKLFVSCPCRTAICSSLVTMIYIHSLGTVISSVADPVHFFLIRIRETPERPDPTGSGSGSYLNMFLMFINFFYGIFIPNLNIL